MHYISLAAWMIRQRIVAENNARAGISGVGGSSATQNRQRCENRNADPHAVTPTRISISTPLTRNTQNSDSGRKTFQPSRINWS